MASIYRALMRAKEEREAQKGESIALARESGDLLNDPLGVEEEMLVLLESIESLPIAQRNKAIQFIGSKDGDRTSRMARSFARTAAIGIGLSVLLVEHARPSSPLDETFAREFGLPWPRTPQRVHGKTVPVCQVEEATLSVCRSFDGILNPDDPPRPDEEHDPQGSLRERYDLVVIDSGSIHDLSRSTPVNPYVDAVVLIFESEMTDLASTEKTDEFGLASVLENVAQGSLSPVKTIHCLGSILLLLVPRGPDRAPAVG